MARLSRIRIRSGQDVIADVIAETGDQSIVTGMIAEGESLFSPSSLGDQSIAAGLITEGEALFSPSPVQGGAPQSIATGLIAESEALLSPSVDPGLVSVAPGLVAEGESLFTPSVTQSSGDQSRTPALVTEGEVLFSPSPSPGGISAIPGLVAESESLLSPSVDQSIRVSIGLITEGEELFSPTPVVSEALVAPGLITEAEELFSPSLGAQVFAGKFNVKCSYPTGRTVTIVVYSIEDGQVVPTDDNRVREIPGTGVYVWNKGHITAPDPGYIEYAYIVDDGSSTQDGCFTMIDGKPPEYVQAEIWRRAALDRHNPLTNQSDGGLSVGDIEISPTASGENIIQTRQ